MKHFKKIVLSFAVVLMFSLTACSSGPIVGTVVDKSHREAHTKIVQICVTYKDGLCTSKMPQTQRVPERWTLHVEVEDAKIRTTNVSAGEWEGTKLGDHYSNAPTTESPRPE